MSQKKIFKKPELNVYNDNKSDERKVSWLELYFDLFFVVVMYYLVHELAHDFSLHHLYEYTLMFLSSLWLWISYTYYKEVFQNHGLEIRIFTFLYMIPIGSLAVFSNDAINGNMDYYILSYFIARLMLTLAWVHGSYVHQEFKKAGQKLFKGVILSLILLIGAYFDIFGSASILFLAAIIIDYINPLFAIHKQSELKLDLSRLPERFGLFLIIVIGEIVRGVISSLSSASQVNFEYITSSILLFALSYGLWSIYFDYLPNKLVTKSLKKTFTWIYLHVLIIYCLTLIGGILLNFNISDLGNSHPTLSLYLTFSVASFMLLMGIIGKIIDGKKVNIVEKKRSSIKIYTGIAIIIFGIITYQCSIITLLCGIVGLLFLQMIYTIRLWKNSEKFE